MLQDLSMHKEEIHSKLVAIMRERLATNLKQLPVIATTWAGSPAAPGLPPPPSNFAQTNAKQLRILSQVCDQLALHIGTLRHSTMRHSSDRACRAVPSQACRSTAEYTIVPFLWYKLSMI